MSSRRTLPPPPDRPAPESSTGRTLARLVCGLALVAAVSNGCASYAPRPIDAASVEEALAPPPPERLVVEASSLDHPILRPIRLELGDGLSEDEAAVLAVLVNPSLRALRHERDLAEAQLLEAGILPNPQLSLVVEPVTGGTSAGTVSGWGVGLGWDVAELLPRGARQQAAIAHRDSVALDVAWEEWQVALDAKSTVRRVLALTARSELANQSAHELDDEVETVRAAVEAGQITGRDAAAAEAARDEARAQRTEADADLALERLELDRLLGLAPGTEVSVQASDATATEAVPEAAIVLEHLEDRRLDLVALRLGYQSQDDTLRAEILAQFPKVNIGFTQARDTGNVVTSGLGVTIDLPLFDRNQAAIATATATRSQLFDEYAERVFEARADVTRLVAQLHGLAQRIAAARDALPNLERAAALYRTAMHEGQVDALSYYEVLGALTSKRMELFDLSDQRNDAEMALTLAGGLYRPVTTSAPGAAADAPPGPVPSPGRTE